MSATACLLCLPVTCVNPLRATLSAYRVPVHTSVRVAGYGTVTLRCIAALLRRRAAA